MDILVVLIPLALVLGLCFIILFIWATLRGQYDDLETPPQKILIDDVHRPLNNPVHGDKK